MKYKLSRLYQFLFATHARALSKNLGEILEYIPDGTYGDEKHNIQKYSRYVVHRLGKEHVFVVLNYPRQSILAKHVS